MPWRRPKTQGWENGPSSHLQSQFRTEMHFPPSHSARHAAGLFPSFETCALVWTDETAIVVALDGIAGRHRRYIRQKKRRSSCQISWEPLDHPPYSPDLATSEFQFFPAFKKALRRQHFTTYTDVEAAICNSSVRIRHFVRTIYFHQLAMNLDTRGPICPFIANNSQ